MYKKFSFKSLAALSALILGAVLAFAAPLPAFAQEVHDFSIDKGDAATAVRTLGAQSQTQILVSSTALKGRSLNAVSGSLSTDQAVSQLLSGSGLTYQYVDDRTIAVLPSGDASVGAAPQARGATVTHTADTAPGNSRILLAQAEAPRLAQNSAGAEASPPAPASAANDNLLGEIIVTGTRRRDRTVVESSAPIDVLNGSDLQAQSNSNMLDTLSNMVPSFIVGQNSISDASSFVRSPSLRGLPGDEMLVMLNGKRMNRSALVQVYQGGETELSFGSQGPDLASIPSIAIKSLEILRDGASAQYGSDAIAGVLNYQFRDNSSGIEVTSRLGRYFPGRGYPNDGTDREVAANIGLPLGSQGFVNFSAEWTRNDQTVRNVTRPSALAFAENYPNLAPELPHYPGPVQQWGTPPSEAVKAVLNGGVKLSDSELYFFANYANIQTNESFNYRLPKTVTDTAGNTFGHHPAFSDIYLDPCTSAYTGCPAGGYIMDSNTFNFASVYPAGFTPRFYGITQEFFGAVGYKGTTAFGMNYDVSGSTATNTLGLSLHSSLNPSLGPLSPTSFYDGKFAQRESTLNIDLSYPWTVAGLASPVSLAGGVEWRDENYQQLPGDSASYAAGPYANQPLYSCAGTVCTPALDSNGNQITATQSTASNGYGGISQGIDASQVSYSLYGDVEADVLKDLTMGVATRFEHYGSFGSKTLGKFQIRWKATDFLSVRGTASTGFHAPTPGQSNVETLSTTFVPGTANQVQIGTYPVTSSVARYYGATALRPEESTNFSAGIVLTPMQDLLVTLDGYSIAVRHRIGISQQFTVTNADIPKLHDLAYVGAGGTVQYFTNGFDTRTKGVDVVGTYKMFVGAGKLATTLAYNYNKTDVTSYDPTVINQARIIDIQHYAPNSRANLNLDYQLAKFTASLHENYYGTFRDENDYPGQLFSAKWTTDVDFGYNVWRDITVAVGGRNIFNAYPDKIANSAADKVYATTGGLIDGEVYPRTGGPFGFNGAFFYARFVAKF
jgi:iron complex outermembrane receptor protein